MKPLRFISFGGYRRWNRYWWRDLITWAAYRWTRDVRVYWYRARHGFAPRDTGALDAYLCHVLAGALAYLADHHHGSPPGYPNPAPNVDDATDHDRWTADLRRWARAFAEYPDDVDIYDAPNYERQRAEENRRRAAINDALRELTPWFWALWD